MPSWEGIEDSSAIAAKIWMSREKEEDEWQPLRKSDCRALNQSTSTQVVIEGGRATADLTTNEIKYNFYNSPMRQMSSATWFVKEEKSSKVFSFKPMTQIDAAIVEELYQKAVQATSSLGSGISTVIQEEHELMDNADYKVVISKTTSNVLSMKMKAKGWFGNTLDLQRGHGEYISEGEEDEVMLGPVNHLFFVVHGIGEALWSRQDVSVPSIVEEMNRTRILMQRKQVSDWKKECEKAKKAREAEPPAPNRIELIPIEWFDRIHSSSSDLMKSLKATTLQTIPALRAIANDVVFDVMMYLTPEFCKVVLECVSVQIEDLFYRFQDVHPDFKSNGGKFSLIGHSLGSVIVWDLLSVLNDRSAKKVTGSKIITKSDDSPSPKEASVENGCRACPAGTDDSYAHPVINGSWGPSLHAPMTHTIPFVPEFTIFLGSPIGLFLTLRGAHAVFDQLLQMELTEKAKLDNGIDDISSITSPFTLPSGSIYNIFHPSDPVAYRIEPLLMSRETIESNVPPPQYLVKKGGKVRLHLQAMQLGDGIRRNFAEKTSNWSLIIASVTNSVAAIQSSTNAEGTTNKNVSRSLVRQGPIKFALGGKSDRVDFQLQPGVIDNEYFSAVMAHSSYFTNSDFLDFLLDLVDTTHIDVSLAETEQLNVKNI